MPRGPLPAAQKRRRNPPTIPTTSLPVSGRKGRPPACPYPLKRAGREWWKWAWTLPQTAAWDKGSMYALGRRAALEDDLATLDEFDHLDLAELLGMEDNDAMRQLGFLIGRIKGLAGGRISILKEMRELDKRFGLDPKALAENRWKIVEDEPTEAAKPPAPKRSGKKRHLRAVDPQAAASA